MKFSERWLREWVNPPVNIQELVEQLTMAGLEIESITPVAGDFKGVIIGKVNKVEPHPDADRLRVCEVDVGQNEFLTIVCGASNVRADLKVAVAMIGAVLPGDFTIKTAKLRGVSSQGMICSAAELKLQEDSTGIMELPVEAPIGEDFRSWLQLNDHVLDVHLTPNRGDCLSVAGMAREVAVLNNISFNKIPPNSPFSKGGTQEVPFSKEGKQDIPPFEKGELGGIYKINIQAPAACPRYLGRTIHNINSQAKIPIEIIERLRRSGLRSIHPVVDITNYVMLELGQPLHAFDLAKLAGDICVRFARVGEEIVLLNDQKVNLDEKTLVIADKNHTHAIAGVMGGLISAVSTGTKDIFLESAFFSPLTIAGQARRYGLNTDSAYRFERGVDPELPPIALKRVTQLLLEIVGGEADSIIEKTVDVHLPKPSTILLRKARVERLLGINIASDKIKTILSQLGMKIENKSEEGWLVIPPSYRYDIVIEADLIEEIARIHGYSAIPAQQPVEKFSFIPQSETQITSARLRQLLMERDYQEAITYSFTAPRLQKLIDPDREPLVLANPISTELSVMRTSLWPGLLEAVIYNQNRQQSRIRLFEMGLRFLPKNREVNQQSMLAGIVVGNIYSEQWGTLPRPVDFFDVKKDLEMLFNLTGKSNDFVFQKAEHPALHPSQTSALVYQGNNIGYVGAIHPALLQALELNGPIYLFELEMNYLTIMRLPKFKEFSKFPSIRRDISFWTDTTISLQKISTVVRESAGEWLVDLVLFDVYRGKNNDSKCSLALGLILQHPERTLVDTEVDEIVAHVIAVLEKRFTIKLRD